MSVIFCGKRDFAVVIQLKLLRWGDCAGLFQWAWYHHKVPIRRKQEESESDQSDVAVTAEAQRDV